MINLLFLIFSLFNAMESVPHQECTINRVEGFQVYHCGTINYGVSVPSECLETSCGLIVDIHGQGMNMNLQNTLTGFRSKGADAASPYVVIQPEQPQEDWGLDWEGNTEKLAADIHSFAEQLDVDSDRVHITGFSQGCYLTWALLCYYPEMVASVGCIGASGHDWWPYSDYVSSCYSDLSGHPQRPILYNTGKFDTTSLIEDSEPMIQKITDYYGVDGPFTFNAYPFANPSEWIHGHCIPTETQTLSSAEETGLDDTIYDEWGFTEQDLYEIIMCTEDWEPGTQEWYSWGDEVLAFFEENPRSISEGTEYWPDESPDDFYFASFSLENVNANVVVYAFAIIGCFSMIYGIGQAVFSKREFEQIGQQLDV